MNSSRSEYGDGLLGQSPEMASVRRLIQRAAGNRLPVLLLGESGTGKEVVARAIHAANPRGQFVPIDCGALVGTLMETELFGHTKGSFSGAVANKKGLVELADGGTAFFDEIGDLPLDMQVKLLRLIQEREFRPVGALNWRKVDIRIVAATHRDLKDLVRAGRFRQDLYYRLNVLVIHLPPLRNHKEDIPLLAEHFLAQGRVAGLQDAHPSDELLAALLSYDWPGNVRELKHCLDRMAAVCSGGPLQLADLPSDLQHHQVSSESNAFAAAAGDKGYLNHEEVPNVIAISTVERKLIARALTAAHGQRAKAARLLGIGRTTLYRKMKEHGIDHTPPKIHA